MKNLFISTALLLAPCFASAHYIDFHGGSAYGHITNTQNSGNKVGYHAGISMGTQLDTNFRVEIEATYRKNTTKNKYVYSDLDVLKSKTHTSSNSWAYMANAYFDVDTLRYKSIIPYIGAGVGYCNNEIRNKVTTTIASHEAKERDERFAYQGIVGARYAYTPEVSIALQYHYFCGKAHTKDHSFGLHLAKHF